MSASGFFATVVGTGLGVALIGAMLAVSVLVVRRWDLAVVGQSLTRFRLAVHRISAPARDRALTVRLDDPRPSTRVAVEPALSPVLRLVADSGRVLPVQGSAVLGRGAESTLRVPDERVSRRHAAVEQVAGRWLVRDLGSTNGTQVNGRSLGGGHDTAALRDGDVLRLGQGGPVFEVRFAITGPATARY